MNMKPIQNGRVIATCNGWCPKVKTSIARACNRRYRNVEWSLYRKHGTSHHHDPASCQGDLILAPGVVCRHEIWRGVSWSDEVQCVGVKCSPNKKQGQGSLSPIMSCDVDTTSFTQWLKAWGVDWIEPKVCSQAHIVCRQGWGGIVLYRQTVGTSLVCTRDQGS